MGYSCTAKASDKLRAIQDYLNQNHPEQIGVASGNSWKFKGKVYFCEIGRENCDGAITGSVWNLYDTLTEKRHCRKAGTFRIEPNGTVARFPHIPKEAKNATPKQF